MTVRYTDTKMQAKMMLKTMQHLLINTLNLTAYCIFLDIPVTAAPAERTFSQLNNYLKATKAHDKLQN